MKKIILIGLLAFVFMNQKFSALSLEQYKSASIKIEIKGEVKQPGVYTLSKSSTYQDAIQAAMGFTDQADTDAINLNRDIFNKDVIVIASKKSIAKISLNAASKEELCTLPNVGPSIAQKIIDYREQFGSFQNIEDIMNIKGIKEKLFAKIKDLITL